MKRIIAFFTKYALHISFVQAWAAMLGSLYFSEILHYKPCLLCWYQRILMYPLTVILGIAILRRDKNVAYYVLPLALLGVIIALYQYLLQMTSLAQITPISCNSLGSCSEIQIMYLGFITIPFLSLCAFAIISLMMVLLFIHKRK